MTIVQPPNQPEKTTFHWPSLLQFILSLLTAFVLIGAAIVVIISAVFRSSTHAAGASDSTGSFMVAASLAFAGVLVLPSAWYAWKHIAYPEEVAVLRPRGTRFGLILTIVVIILLVGTLLLGNWSAQNHRLTWLALPLLNIFATGLPALWTIYIGTHGLIPSQPRRQWGVFASGLVLGPLIISVLELFALAFIGLLAVLWMMLNPTLANQLYGAAIRLQNPGQDLNAVARIMLPLLLDPGVLFLGFAFISVLVPLLEEALKPIGVWFLSRQKITPAQGFAYGVLSGAGYGLFENLVSTSSGGTEWALVAAARISALVLHSFTAGLLGWALASAWSEKRYLRLGIAYAIAVIAHGLWNGLAIVSAAPSLRSVTNTGLPANLQQIGSIASDGVIVLAVLVFLLYIGFNTILRRNLAFAAQAISGDNQIPRLDQSEIPTPNVDVKQLAGEINPNPPSPGNHPMNPEAEQSNQHNDL